MVDEQQLIVDLDVATLAAEPGIDPQAEVTVSRIWRRARCIKPGTRKGNMDIMMTRKIWVFGNRGG